jgi:capsular polysaccharide biosynthesis protein
VRSSATVIPKQKSELIDVAVNAKHAPDAAVLANAVVEEFLKYDSENVQREDAQLFEKLTEELERRAARIRDMQAGRSATERRHG